MGDPDWHAVLSTAFGGASVLVLAKYLLARTLADLDQVIRKVEDQAIRLAAINVKLEVVDRLRQTVAEHDRQIVMLDVRSQSNVAQGRPPSNRSP